MKGHLVLDPKAEHWLRRYEDEPIHVELTPVHARRSIPANRRLWAGYASALKVAATLLPYSKEELHAACVQRSEVIPEAMLYLPNGEPIGISKSTRRLPVPKFAEFNEEVSALFARGGIDIYPDGPEVKP